MEMKYKMPIFFASLDECLKKNDNGYYFSYDVDTGATYCFYNGVKMRRVDSNELMALILKELKGGKKKIGNRK